MAERYWEVKSKIDQVEGTQEWVKKQVREELIKLNKECFYEIKWEEVTYNMDTVKHYLNSIKDKKTWKELTMNNSSVLIMAVQIALYSQNYKFWRIDGLLGPKTKAAIKKFQADNGLSVDTYWRTMPTTIAKLLEKITPMESVELNEEEKKEYLIFRPKNEEQDKENKNKPYNWWEQPERQVTWNPQLNKPTDEKEINIPLRPSDDKSKPEEKKQEKDKETHIDQSKIRPEVQSMIDNYRNEADKFHTLKEITLAEAKAIWELKWGFLTLTWLEKLSPESFGELTKFDWWIELWINELTPEMAKKLEWRRYLTVFKNLENITKETAEELWKTTCWLEFWSIKTLDANILELLTKKQSWNIEFTAVESINEEAAKVIAKYPWTIILNNVKSISGEVAKILWSKRKWIILKWLDASKPLPHDVLAWLSQIENGLQLNNDTFEQIYRYKVEQKRMWKELSETVVNVLDHNANIDELSKLKKITKDDAEMLVERWGHWDLSWVEYMDWETFKILMKNKWAITLWMKEIPEEYWKYMELRSWGLNFKNLEVLTPKIAESLAKTYWRIEFDAITNIDGKAAEELSKKYRWDIAFNWIKELTPEIINNFKEYRWTVIFKNVETITPEIAKLLAEKNTWYISLRWLKAPLSEELLPIISKAKNINYDSEILWQIHKYLYPERYE